MTVKKPWDVIEAVEAWEKRYLTVGVPGSGVYRTLLESGVGWVVCLGPMGSIKAFGYGTTAAEAFAAAEKEAKAMIGEPGRRRKRSGP